MVKTFNMCHYCKENNEMNQVSHTLGKNWQAKNGRFRVNYSLAVFDDHYILLVLLSTRS